MEYSLSQADCILLECIRFVEPIIPEGFTPPTIEEVRATRHNDNNDDLEDGRKTKKRKVDTGAANGPNGVNGIGAPAAPHVGNGGLPVNGHAHAPVQPPINSHAPAPPSARVATSPVTTSHHASSGAGIPTQIKPPTPSSVAYPSPVSLTQSRPTFDFSAQHRSADQHFGANSGIGAYRGVYTAGFGSANMPTSTNGAARLGSIVQPSMPGPVHHLTNGLSRADAIDMASSDHEM